MTQIESNVLEDLDGFEQALVDALQPVRYYFVAQVTNYLFESGMFEALKEGMDLRAGGFAPARLNAVLRFLSNEGLVQISDERAALTSAGRALERFAPWYQLLIGGYGRTLDSLDTVLHDQERYAPRDDASVGAGSCGISHFDAVPIFRALIEDQRVAPDTIIDLGCGDGQVLLELADLGGRVIGVDPAPSSVEAARANARAANMEERATFLVGTGETWWASAPGHFAAGEQRIDYVMGFALQEVIEQSGRQAAVDLVRRATAEPGTALLVVEVEPQPTPHMQHPLDLSYYNPYYLMHKITRQRLEARDYWREIVADAGAYVAASAAPPSGVDTTGHEFGMRIERNVA